ncbi:MAG: hypothetical protein AAF550_00175 [Myxococcota bacterium]
MFHCCSVGAFTLTVLACSEDSGSVLSSDSGVAFDASSSDGSAGPIDGSGSGDGSLDMDGGSALDGSVQDGGPDDGGLILDGGGDASAAITDPCSFVTDEEVLDCATDVLICPPNTECLDTGCDEFVCMPSGRLCNDSEAMVGGSTNCSEHSSCAFAGSVVESVCVSNSDSCNDSRDCPLGFSCDEGTCIDRRVLCDPFEDACPAGFFCADSGGSSSVRLPGSPPICVRLHTPCENDDACISLFGVSACVDVNSDGSSECSFPGACTFLSDCGVEGQVCGKTAFSPVTECQIYGPCTATSDCAAGLICTDIWGDGIDECVEIGDCAAQSDCPPGQLCAMPVGGGPTTCIQTPPVRD